MSGSYKHSATIKLLLALFLIAAVTRAVFLDTSYFFWDESVYLLHGQIFAGQPVGYSETFLRPPLLPLALSPLIQLNFYELASRLLMAVLNSLVVLPVFFLTKAVFGRRQAVIAAIIVAFLPVHILNSRWILTDALGALLAFSSVAAFIIGLQQNKRMLTCAGGLLAGLAVLMKFTNLLIVPLLLPLFILYRKRLAAVVVSLLIFAAVVAPYFIWSQLAFGSPFYTLGRAFHVVAESDSSGAAFFLYLLLDGLGAFLVFLMLGILFAFRQQRELKARYYLLYCMAAYAAYSFFIIGRGVSKPSGIEWETGRFLLLFTLFAIPFIGNGLVVFANSLLALLTRRIPGSFSSRMGSLLFGFAAAAVVAVPLLFMLPQFERAYAPAVTFEDGLREATKELGIYIGNSDIAEFACLGNCPPLAYYSGKKMSVYYGLADLEASSHGSIVIFDSASDALLQQYSMSKKICSGSSCAYLFSRQ